MFLIHNNQQYIMPDIRFSKTKEVVHTDINQLPSECIGLAFVAEKLKERGFIIKGITSEYDISEYGNNRLVGCEVRFTDQKTEKLSKEIGKSVSSSVYYNAIYNEYIIDFVMITDKTEYLPSFIDLSREDISKEIAFRPTFERVGSYNIIGFNMAGVRDMFKVKEAIYILYD